MIGIESFAAAMLAGMIYVLVPGPATLATLSLSATRGRGAALRFLAAHLVGDLGWSLLALLALAGVSWLGPGLFDLLGLACGCWLIWLGLRALTAPPGGADAPLVRDPIRAGLIFGLSNPKAYPFALAMLTALLGPSAAGIGWASGAQLLAGCALGFVLADLIVIFWTGLSGIRQVYHRHARMISHALGLAFIAFGLKSAHDAAQAMRARL